MTTYKPKPKPRKSKMTAAKEHKIKVDQIRTRRNG